MQITDTAQITKVLKTFCTNCLLVDGKEKLFFSCDYSLVTIPLRFAEKRENHESSGTLYYSRSPLVK